MSDPFLGEIVMFGGSFAPRNWALCDGQLLTISQHQALFSILGTMYGGNGRTNFGLPDLRGRVAIHAGQGAGLTNRNLGEEGGTETATLSVNQMPPHTHPLEGNTNRGKSASPTNSVLAVVNRHDQYFEGVANTPMNTTSIGNTGGNQGHANIQPFTCVNFIIALQGTFPSRN